MTPEQLKAMTLEAFERMFNSGDLTYAAASATYNEQII